MESFIFFKEKRYGRVKARTYENVRKKRKWISKEDLSSTTAELESVLFTKISYAKEWIDVLLVGIPNTFI